MAKLFLPQTRLEAWANEDQVDLQEGNIFIKAERLSYPWVPAVHFLTVLSGGDKNRLLSKVKTAAQLVELSAEHLMNSVILNEDAYEVDPGFLVDVPLKSADVDLLAAFMIDKMS